MAGFGAKEQLVSHEVMYRHVPLRKNPYTYNIVTGL